MRQPIPVPSDSRRRQTTQRKVAKGPFPGPDQHRLRSLQHGSGRSKHRPTDRQAQPRRRQPRRGRDIFRRGGRVLMRLFQGFRSGDLFLGSRLARRILLLFFTCALLPVVAITFLAFRQVLIRQILEISRASDRPHEAVDIAEIVRETSRLLRRTIPASITIEVQVGDGEHHVLADPAQIQQVVTNLAVNARDAMPQGGELCLSIHGLELRPSDTLPTPRLRPGEWVVISVSDTGEGIPEDARPRIFEPFFTTKAPGQGTGLGLAQVYAAVTHLGGVIEMESVEGVGTTFTIFLPRSGDVDHLEEGHQHLTDVLVVLDDQYLSHRVLNLLRLSRLLGVTIDSRSLGPSIQHRRARLNPVGIPLGGATPSLSRGSSHIGARGSGREQTTHLWSPKTWTGTSVTLEKLQVWLVSGFPARALADQCALCEGRTVPYSEEWNPDRYGANADAQSRSRRSQNR